MILDQLFETAGQDNTIYQVSRAMLDNNPGRSYLRASDDDTLRDAARELSRMGMSDVKVRAIMRDPDFAGELIDVLRGPLNPVSEGQLDEGMFSNIEQLVDRFYQENDIDPSQQKLEIRSPGTRVWTRFDGARHRDPGRILSKDPQLMTGFWEWLKTQPGVKPMGDVRGAYMSSDYDEAVRYKGAYFAMTKNGHMVYGSMKRVTNPKSVWLQKQDEGVSEAMKPSDIPPSRRDRLTMRDIEAERPAGAFRFRVVTPQGDQINFMDRAAAEQRARAMGGRVEPIDPQPRGLPGRNRFRVQDPQGSRPAATFQDRAAAERYAAAKRLPVEIIPEAKGKKAGARIERILQMLRARHPQAENDLEALIFDFRTQQSQDRTDIARLDAENDAEEADIQRLERMLDLIKRRRGAAAEPVQEDDIDDAMRDYLARGGKVQQEPAKMPRLSTRLRQHGSRHIGQGREPRAGQLSGRGANVAQGGKPVVATESLRDGEYHVATVTLDDATVKKVRITSDEGFRDQIAKHFQKQGRTVKDIDVDYSVRSELDEAKKKPQPTNPELWSRAKSAARSKFDVYPSAYANAWAAKWYKSKGGGWRMGKPKKD